MSSNGREQAQFWRELERVEQWLGTGAGAAAGRIYDTMGRPGQQTFVNYGNELIAGVARVDRVRQALDQSGPVAKRLAMQQLSGIDLSDVWDILVAACKEIALYYGGAVVTGAVVGGAIGSLAFGAGAVPGAIAGGAAGSQVGLWVLTLLGLKDLAVGLTTMFPAAMEHYERGFREAWGPVPDNRRDFGISAAQPSGSSSAGAWHMGQGHVILVTAILTAVVAYLTRGGTTASLSEMARQSRSLGARFGNWAVENERRLLTHPQLQSRPNNSVAMAMGKPPPNSGHGTSSPRTDKKINYVGPIIIDRSALGELLGRGGNKDVFAYGNAEAVGVLRTGKNPALIDEELSLLRQLDKLGLPTVNARGPISVDGQPGLLFDRFAQGSKDIVRLQDGKIRIVGESSLLNQRSVSDLNAIRQSLIDKQIKIDDLQFLIGQDGRVVVADPLRVQVGTAPSKNNLRMIDLLIQQAKAGN